MEVIKGGVGRMEMKRSPKASDSLLIVSIAEEKFAPPTLDSEGKKVWSEPETIWHNDILLRGDDAYLFEKTFQKGDQVILLGDYGKPKQVQLKDGRTVTNQAFFVKHYGPDASRTPVEVVRNPKEQKVSAQAQTQTASAETQSQAVDYLDRSDVQKAETLLQERATKLMKAGHIEQSLFQHLGHAWGSSNDTQDTEDLIKRELANQSPEVQKYLGNVVENLNGKAPIKSWGELFPGEVPTQQNTAPSFEESMAQVADIRAQVRSSM